MAITLKLPGAEIIVDTPEEAARVWAAASVHKQIMLNAARSGERRGMASLSDPNLWNPTRFHEFIDRLGDRQKTALSVMLDVGVFGIEDTELRAILGVSRNQALGGLLSGISKQADAMHIPAREVFSVSNIRRAGRRWSKYFVSPSFTVIANAEGWPTRPAEDAERRMNEIPEKIFGEYLNARIEDEQ
ncbi:MAG: hypothetical protein PW789_14590 [Edaphobacter sp.]|uniref:hypothetical protein n=1 Tax=Edaphobacter sp. TaxID=1934404 RepID=UPI00238D553C|nr:hypothetical protein [Edaphobacter sp.]MDE1177807.1 hypothetical protein [Edaphobacter sp.]